MRYSSFFLSSLALAQSGAAGVLKARQDATSTSAATNGATTSTASSSASGATAGLVETTINGKGTTLQVAVPTGDATDTATSKPTAASTKTGFTPVETVGTGAASLLSCNAPTGNPICLPNNGTAVHVGDTYYVTWDPTRFEVNTTITILLNYANDTDNGNRVAWTSDGTPREKGFVTVKMEDDWRLDTGNATLEFALISYTPVSEHTAKPLDGPTVFLSKTSTRYAPPPKTKLPDNISLYVGVPLGVGGLIFVLLGLYFGMRKHRHIGMKSIMGRRKGYGTRKSKRERLGLKKGAIRLEEREVTDPAVDYRERDEIRPAPAGQDWPMPPGAPRRGTEESLGSLVNDPSDNSFRREMEKQRTGRGGMI